ncbi:MAG: CvpA family protein [Alphaproteobacteria bacterium]|nr:MAG: CvpA family protein [Alphaproteobacteria bacterium]
MPITPIDIIIVAVMLLSGLFALLRGFVREFFTIISWVGAVYFGFAMIPLLGPAFRNVVSVGLAADALAFALPFLLVLFAMQYVSNRLVKNIAGTNPGPIDGTLGFFFGMVRGFVIVTVAYFGFDVFMNPERAPDWLVDAKFRPMIEDTTDFYYTLVPGLKGDKAQTSTYPRQETSSQGDDRGQEPGYSNAEREAIDQLFQSSADD